MRSMQVRATQLQDPSAAQLEVMRARVRELRLRASDLQAREQQAPELQEFRGGAAVYIGGAGLVLLIVLLVILL